MLDVADLKVAEKLKCATVQHVKEQSDRNGAMDLKSKLSKGVAKDARVRAVVEERAAQQLEEEEDEMAAMIESWHDRINKIDFDATRGQPRGPAILADLNEQ